MRNLATTNLRLALLGGAASLLILSPAAAQTPAPTRPAPADVPTFDEDATEVEALLVPERLTEPVRLLAWSCRYPGRALEQPPAA